MKKYTLLAFLMCFSFLAKAQTSSGKHHIKYLDINSANPDIGVSFVDDNQVVVTSTVSDRVINTEKHNPYLDFYTATVDEDGSIVDKKRLKSIQNKKISKNAASFTKEGNKVYFSANKYAKRKSKTPRFEIFSAMVNENGKWNYIEKLPFVNKKYSYSFPTVNKDNSRLYFVSNAEPSFGGTDIFYVDINKDGTYGEPINLGEKVNTAGDETTPFIADNNFLYYSSNGREDTIGGMDVYAVEIFDKIVSEPLHLAAPINSINDDVSYIVNSESKGFFASNRLQGRGNDDIYSFYIEPDKPKACIQEVVGTIRDKDIESLIVEADVKVLNDEGNVIKTLKSDYKGNYKFTVSCNQTYTVVASKPQYSKEEHVVNTANYHEAPPLEVNQFLTKEIKKTVDNKLVVNINPIYFNFDRSNIRQDAKIELDKIVKIMKENPELKIEAASHTDAIGPKYYNQKLSERRAKSTVKYIVSKGIDASRIIAKGYGESQPINDCVDGVRCSIQKHRLNRRTEFVIVNKQVLGYSVDDEEPIINEEKSALPKELESTQELIGTEDEPSIDDNEVTVEDEPTNDLVEADVIKISNSGLPKTTPTKNYVVQHTETEQPSNTDNKVVETTEPTAKTKDVQTEVSGDDTAFNYTKKNRNVNTNNSAEQLIKDIAPEVKKKRSRKKSIASR